MRALDSTFVRFLLVGAINTVFGLLIIYTCKWLLGLDDVKSNMIGYAAGILLSFALNRRWTFKFDGSWTPALGRFIIVSAVAYLANLGTVLSLIELGTNSYLAQALGVPPYTLTGYLGSRFFAFRAPLGSYKNRGTVAGRTPQAIPRRRPSENDE